MFINWEWCCTSCGGYGIFKLKKTDERNLGGGLWKINDLIQLQHLDCNCKVFSLSDDRKCDSAYREFYIEYMEYKATGIVPPNSIIFNISHIFKHRYNLPALDYDFTCNEIFKDIAKRWFESFSEQDIDKQKQQEEFELENTLLTGALFKLVKVNSDLKNRKET